MAINKAFNIFYCLLSYFIFMFFRALNSAYLIPAKSQSVLNVFTSAFLFGAMFLIAYMMPKRKLFYHKGVYIIFTGIALWLGWGIFASLSRLTLHDSVALRELIALTAFSFTLFYTLRIAIFYDLRLRLLEITLFILSILFIAAYITHFDNFALFRAGNLFKVMNNAERYRNAYGLGHPNGAGMLCLNFFLMKAAYKSFLEARNVTEATSTPKYNLFYKYLSLIQVIVLIILLSTGSRSSITGLILSIMVYYAIVFYQKISSYIRIIFITFAIIAAFLIITLVDWQLVYTLSNRAVNYTILPLLTRNNSWITGFGFFRAYDENMIRIIQIPVLDSFYLYILLESGLLGCLFLFGAILCFSYLYFRDIKHMTKSHIISGCILIAMLYHGIFESNLYGHGPYDLITWILFISCLNERIPQKHRPQN